jgi:Peptidase family M28
MKNSFLILLLSIVFVNCSTTQKVAKKPAFDLNTYINAISIDDLRTNLTVIASDEMEGRDTGTEGQKKAGRYIIEQHKKNGVSFPKKADGFYQKVSSEYMQAGFRPKLPDSENIWLFIEGTEKPEEVVVVSAHYDHVGTKNGEIFNGADDDGSGTSALIEVAKAFQKAKNDGVGARRSVLILHVTGEEHGLHGSRFYSENPLFLLKNTVADINIDMVGRRDDFHKDSNNYVYIIGSDFLSTDLHIITQQVNKKYIHLDLDYKYNNKTGPERFYYRSDHYNFAKNGIPSVFLFNGTHDDYHQPTDEVSKIEFDALTKRIEKNVLW